jgi:hypothetical protein
MRNKIGKIDENLTVRLTVELKKFVEEKSKSMNISKGSIVRIAILRLMQEEKKSP